MDAALLERFAGIDRLYGRGAVERLASRKVAVVGLGGVGSWLVEALARSAVGTIELIDADDLCVSNTNRQLPAIAGQYGRNKAQAMAERCLAINPAIDARAVPAFLTGGNLLDVLNDSSIHAMLSTLATAPMASASALGIFATPPLRWHSSAMRLTTCFASMPFASNAGARSTPTESTCGFPAISLVRTEWQQ